jgi:hypothetical protein
MAAAVYYSGRARRWRASEAGRRQGGDGQRRPDPGLQRVASLLDLGDQPAVAELGHAIMPAVL